MAVIWEIVHVYLTIAFFMWGLAHLGGAYLLKSHIPIKVGLTMGLFWPFFFYSFFRGMFRKP